MTKGHRPSPPPAAHSRGGARIAWIALLLWGLAMLLGGLVISRTSFSTDLSAFLPASPDARQRVLTDQLTHGVAARSVLIGIEGGDALQRAAASRALAATLRASGLFEQVLNGETGDWKATGEWLLAHRYQLSPAINPERFSAAGLRDALADTLAGLGTPAGAGFKPLLERDPTGELQRITEALLPSQAPRSEHGVWVARAGPGTVPRALLLAGTRAAGADLDAQALALARIRESFAALATGPQASLVLRLSGAPVFAVQSRATIEFEVQRLALWGSLGIGGLLLLSLGSLRALAVATLPVASGIVAGIVAVGLVHGTVHGITLAFGSTLIGEAVDYAIYYLIQAKPDGGWRRWRDANWPTVKLGLLTSVCGFAALLFSGFPGLAQLGLFSMAGLVAAAAVTRWLLPRLVPNGAQGVGQRQALARMASAGVHHLPRWRSAVLLLALLAAGMLAQQWQHLWRGSLGGLSPVSQAAQDLDTHLRRDLGASDARTLVVATGADMEAALRAAEAAVPRLDALVDQGLLAGYETPTRILPSLASQRARLASLPGSEVLRANLASATLGGPLSVARLAPFMAEVEAARSLPLIDRAGLAGSALAPAVDALLFQRQGGGWSALLPLQAPAARPVSPPASRAADSPHAASVADLPTATLQTALQGLAASADLQVIDIKHELDSLYAQYLREALSQVLLGALAVLALLAASLRSGPRLLKVCGPLALAVLLTLAGLAAFDVALGILHLVGLLLVIAVGSNYGLFFDQLEQGGHLDADTLASLLLANLTTVVSFGLLAGSDIPALSAIGRVVAPGALLALLLAAVFHRQAGGPAAKARPGT